MDAPETPPETQKTRLERETREITEIALILLRDKPPGTAIRDVWARALDVWRIQFVLEDLR